MRRVNRAFLSRAASWSLIWSLWTPYSRVPVSAPVLTSLVRAWSPGTGVGFSSSATWWLICCHQSPSDPRIPCGRAVIRRGRSPSSFFLVGATGHPIASWYREKNPRTLGLIDLALNSSSVCVMLGKFPHLLLLSLFPHL